MGKVVSFFRLFKNFYFAVGFSALVWMLFFDQFSIPSQLKVRRRIKALREEMQFYKREQTRLLEMTELRGNDMDELERFAREHHWMKKDNEDLFIVVEK